MEEEEIYEGCVRGDNTSRKALYDCYAGRLLALGIRYMGSREAAEDILHDVFITVFSSIGKFAYRGKGSLFAWMSRIMVNAALEQLRKEKYHSEVAVETVQDELLDDDGSNMELVPRNVLMHFISELPDGYRTVFNLYAFEGKSHREIASILGINEKSSSSQFYRARTMLMKRINEYTKKTI